MLDLEKRGKDIRRFVHSLEGWMIDTLAELGVEAHRAPGRIGIWVGEGPGRSQDRSARGSGEAMGYASRIRHQRCARLVAF